MKKVQIVLITILLMIITSLSVIAHPGRTDENGGHYDHSNGEYHYHDGSSAGKNNNSNNHYNYKEQCVDCSVSIPYPNWRCTTCSRLAKCDICGEKLSVAELYTCDDCMYQAEGFTVKNKTVTNANKISSGVITLIIVALVAVVFIVRLIILKLIERKQEKERRIKEEQEFLKEKRIMTQRYGGRPISDFVEIPSDSEIGEDNLPRIKNTTQFWGTKYTFYVSSTGRYHKSSCIYAQHQLPVNAYVIKKRRYYAPCYHCKPDLPNMDWVDEYLRIKAIKERYHIDTPERSNP